MLDSPGIPFVIFMPADFFGFCYFVLPVALQKRRLEPEASLFMNIVKASEKKILFF